MKASLEEVECPICGPCSSADFSVSDGMKIVRCTGCGLLYVNPRLTSGVIEQHFSDEYITDEKRVEEGFVSFREQSLGREAAIIKGFISGGRLLDLGTGPGTFLRYLEGSPGLELEGVEPSLYAAKYGREKFNLKIYTGFLDEQAFDDESFDCVTSLDAFMLHPDPNTDLKEISRILKPGAIFAVEIPGLSFRLLKNHGLLSKVIYGERTRLNPKVHLYYYSRKTLTRLLKKHGFDLVSVHAEQSPLYGSVAVRLLNRFYFSLSKAVAFISMGLVNFVPKEFYIFRKVPL